MLPSFSDLRKHYPKGQYPCDGPWDNQCAIRLSIALVDSGFSLATYGDPKCVHGHARGAESLANFLYSIKPAFKYKGAQKTKVAGKKGIIFFRNLTGFRGGQGDHIDLWDGSKTRTGEYFSRVKEFWFWKL